MSKRQQKCIKEIVTALACFLLVLVLNFFLPRLLSGDPIGYLTGMDETAMSESEYLYYYHALHLDEPIGNQFLYYLKSLFDGTLGYSYVKDQSVASLLFRALPVSLELMLPATIISLFLGLVWGLKAGYLNGSKMERGSSFSLLVLNSFPSFALGLILLICFSFALPLFPYSGLESGAYPQGSFLNFLDHLYHLFLPTLTLVLATLPSRYLLMKNLAKEYRNHPSVRYVESMGLSLIRIRYSYVLRNVMTPYLSSASLAIGTCFAGSAVIENVFSLKGVGSLINEAIHTLDYPLLQGVLFFVTTCVALVVVLFDVVILFSGRRGSDEA